MIFVCHWIGSPHSIQCWNMLSLIRGYLWFYSFILCHSEILSLIHSLQFSYATLWGIVDAPDLEWYTAILDECKLLDINDFLQDVSPYVVTLPLPPQRTAPLNVS